MTDLIKSVCMLLGLFAGYVGSTLVIREILESWKGDRLMTFLIVMVVCAMLILLVTLITANMIETID